jgi:hypothetical protein
MSLASAIQHFVLLGGPLIVLLWTSDGFMGEPRASLKRLFPASMIWAGCCTLVSMVVDAREEFVLTDYLVYLVLAPFVGALIGSIVGIVLAPTTMYALKRYRNSQPGLAPFAVTTFSAFSLACLGFVLFLAILNEHGSLDRSILSVLYEEMGRDLLLTMGTAAVITLGMLYSRFGLPAMYFVLPNVLFAWAILPVCQFFIGPMSQSVAGVMSAVLAQVPSQFMLRRDRQAAKR